MAISNFHVTFKGDVTTYRPGDELSGTVIMDVWSTVEIKYVDFVITGRGTLRTFKVNAKEEEQPRHEVYLDKKIVLIGPATGSHGVQVTRTGVTLTPGRYVSHFKYILPIELPPSVHQFDLGEGYVFDVSYSVAANVCDNLRSRYLPHAAQLIRVVKSTRRNFNVSTYFDWQGLPNALDPVNHAEQVRLYCAPRSGPVTVMLQMERSVYPLGDSINLHVEILASNLRKIKEVRTELEQTLLLPWKNVRRFTNILIKAYDSYKNRDRRKLKENIARSSFAIQIPPRLVPSYLPHCHLVGVSYHIKVSVVFTGLSGMLVMRIPIIIAPESPKDAETRLRDEALFFQRPAIQFPFSRSYGSDGRSTVPQRSYQSTERSTNPFRSYQSTDGRSTVSEMNSLSRLALHRMASDRFTKHSRISSNYITSCDSCVHCLGFGLYE